MRSWADGWQWLADWSGGLESLRKNRGRLRYGKSHWKKKYTKGKFIYYLLGQHLPNVTTDEAEHLMMNGELNQV